MFDFSSFDALLGSDPLAALEMARTAVRALEAEEGTQALEAEEACARAQTFDALGTAYRVVGDYTKADRTYTKAETICSCPRCRPDRLLRITYLRAMQGEHTAAVARGRQALEEAQTAEDGARAHVAAAFAYRQAGDYRRAIESARAGLMSLSDLLFVSAAVSTIAHATLREDPPDEAVLRHCLAELKKLRKSWPYSRRYRAIRARIRLSIGYIRHKLGETTDRDLRRTLASAQGTMVDLGLLRDALDMLAEAAEICAGMRFEELAAETIQAMIDALPTSLPRHLAAAVRKLRRSLEAVDRDEIRRAATELRAALTLRSSAVV